MGLFGRKKENKDNDAERNKHAEDFIQAASENWDWEDNGAVDDMQVDDRQVDDTQVDDRQVDDKQVDDTQVDDSEPQGNGLAGGTGLSDETQGPEFSGQGTDFGVTLDSGEAVDISGMQSRDTVGHELEAEADEDDEFQRELERRNAEHEQASVAESDATSYSEGGSKTENDAPKYAAEAIRTATTSIIKKLSGAEHSNSIGLSKVPDNIIAVVGAAGGVGTSTLVANTAVALDRMGLHVLVVDTNLQYPSAHTFFGIEQGINKKDFVSFLLGKDNIGSCLQRFGGISVLCANNRTMLDSINCDNDKCSENLIHAIKEVRELFDVILFDCGRNAEHDIVNTALFLADAIYVVWDESIGCVSNTDRIKCNLALSGIEVGSKIKLVLNKRTSVHYSKKAYKGLGLEMVGLLPFDVAVIESGLRGEIFLLKGQSMSKGAQKFSAGIYGLADSIVKGAGYER